MSIERNLDETVTIEDAGNGQSSSSTGSAEQLLLDAESDQEPVLSVVMPTLNEEAGIAECIERTKAAIAELGVTAEIILSDSSTDRTPDIGREMGAIVYEPDEPGYGYAYRYAFERTRGEFIVMGDADTTYDFTEIPRLLNHLQETDADIVMGSRLDGDIKPGAMPPLHQYIGNPLLTRFLNTFYDAGVSDAHSGFRVLERDVLDEVELHTDGMEFASEMIMAGAARGLTIEEVPITYHEREGEETLDSFRDGWRHVRFMLTNAPGYLFSIPGSVLAVVGLLTIVLAVTNFSVNGHVPGTNSMIASSLFLLLGYQVWSFGIFATITGDPIQRPSDSMTQWLVSQLSLERGATVGFVAFGLGAGYALSLVVEWVLSGYVAVPQTSQSILAFTTIVLGIQTIFSAFFFSLADSQC